MPATIIRNQAVASASAASSQQNSNVSTEVVRTPIYKNVLDTERYNQFVQEKQKAYETSVGQKAAEVQARTTKELGERTERFKGKERFVRPLEQPLFSVAGKRAEAETGQQTQIVEQAGKEVTEFSEKEFAKTKAEAEQAKSQFVRRQKVGYTETTYTTTKTPKEDTEYPSGGPTVAGSKTGIGSTIQPKVKEKVVLGVPYSVEAQRAVDLGLAKLEGGKLVQTSKGKLINYLETGKQQFVEKRDEIIGGIKRDIFKIQEPELLPVKEAPQFTTGPTPGGVKVDKTKVGFKEFAKGGAFENNPIEGIQYRIAGEQEKISAGNLPDILKVPAKAGLSVASGALEFGAGVAQLGKKTGEYVSTRSTEQVGQDIYGAGSFVVANPQVIPATAGAVIYGTVKETIERPLESAGGLKAFGVADKSLGKLIKTASNVGAIESKPVLFLEKGRGTKYAVEGKPAVKLPDSEPSLFNVLKYDVLKSKVPVSVEAPKGFGFVEGAIAKDAPTIEFFKSGKPVTFSQQISQTEAVTIEKFIGSTKKPVYVKRVEPFDVLKPSTYIDALSGKKAGQFKKLFFEQKTDILLKDYPSEMIGRDIAKMAGKTTTGASVSPGPSTPFKRIFNVSKGTYEVVEMPGTSILRTFGGGIERGQFFAPATKTSTALEYKSGELKPALTTVKEIELGKLQRKAKTEIVKKPEQVIPSKELSLIRSVAEKRDSLVMTGSSAEQFFTKTKLGAKDIDFVSTQAKKDAELFVQEAKALGKKAEIKPAQHPGTYNVVIDGKPIIQVSQTRKLPSFERVGGMKVYKPSEAIKNKFEALSNPLVEFRHSKDVARLREIVEGRPSTKTLLSKVNPEKEIPQAYVYYAGLGKETTLLDVASGRARVGFGRSPKIEFEKMFAEKLPKDLLNKPTKAEIDAIKQEFADRFALAKKVEAGTVEKPAEFLSTSDLERLLKRGNYEDYALYRRVTQRLNVPGTTQVGAGALTGLRTELELIKAAGSVSEKVQITKGLRSTLSKFLDIGEKQIKYGKTGDVFGAVYQKNTKLAAKETETAISKATENRARETSSWMNKASRDLKSSELSQKPVYPVGRLASRVASALSFGRGSIAPVQSSERPTIISSKQTQSSSAPSRFSVSGTGSGFSGETYSASSISSVSSSTSIVSGGSSSPPPSSITSVTSKITSETSSGTSSLSKVSSGISGISFRVPPTPPRVPPSNLRFGFEDSSKRKKRRKLFDVTVRKKGKQRIIGTKLFYEEAVRRGKQFAESTAGRTFALRSSGFAETDVGGGVTPSLFAFRAPARGSKLRRLGEQVFVQRSKYAISSRGEKRELQQRRREVQSGKSLFNKLTAKITKRR